MRGFWQSQNLGFMKVFLGFIMGMMGQLYIQMPGMGIMPMLDILSYAIAPLLLLLFWTRMGKQMRRCVLWGITWSCAAVFANFMTFREFRYALKSVVIVCSSWTIMTVAWWLLRQDARIYLWYLCGLAIGGYISLYYFQPGTVACLEWATGGRAIDYLMEKERFPCYTRLIIYGCLLPLCYFWRKVPSLLILMGVLGAGLFLLFQGGSRSQFGVYAAAAFVGFIVRSMRQMAARIVKHTFLVLILVAIGAATLYCVYSHWASTGALGESERNKYERENEWAEDSGQNRLAMRGGFDETIAVIKEKPWGEGGTNMRHSVISNTLNCEGLVGLFFWVYFCSCLLWFIKNRLVCSGIFATFFTMIMINQFWNMLGSPFGARHGYFVLMAFIALCRDNLGYGLGTVFELDEKTK